MTSKQRIAELLDKHLKRELSMAEEAELAAWIEQSPDHRRFFGQITDEAYLQKLLSDTAGAKRRGREILFRQLMETSRAPGRFRAGFKKYMSAAAIFILFAGGLYVWIASSKKEMTVADAIPDTKRFQNDVPAPEGSKAVLTLADGTRVSLDQAPDGSIAEQGQAAVIKKAGQVVYEAGPAASSAETVYNVLSTANGGFSLLTLPDGSKVWLNAASSLRFPTSFSGKERKVTLTGEGYFEIAKDNNRKFLVESNGTTTEVLGTHFNINSYEDEKNVKVTLLEGSVRTLMNDQNLVLKPGQQAVISTSAMRVTQPDLQKVMAWKNGRFLLDGSDVRSIMRDLERWYNVEVEYEGRVPTHEFIGDISRKESLSVVLRLMEMTELVHFKVEGRTITVMP